MRRDKQFLGVDRSPQRAWAKGQAMNVSASVATRPSDENRPPHLHHSPPCTNAADIVVTNAPRKVVTNAASTGIRIDRKQLKSLARRSDAPGLTYLATWGVALGVTGSLVWLALGTLYVWPAMFAYGVVMSVPAYSLSHETAHGTAFRTRRLNETVFWITSLLYGEEPLHRRYTHTNHHTHTWYVGLDSQMPFDTPLDFKGWLYDISGLSLHRFQLRVLWQLATGRYTTLMREVSPEAELPKMTRNARIFWLVYVGMAASIAAGYAWLLWLYVLPRLMGGPIMLMFNRRRLLEDCQGDDAMNHTRIFMFLVDICGESERPPGHARAFADLPSFRRRLADERRRGLREFRSAVMDGRYPDAETSVSMLPGEHLNFLEALDARPNFHS